MSDELESDEALGSHCHEDATMPKFGIDNPNLLKLDVESNVPLYERSHLSMLTCILMLLNACASHKCTNVFMDELLSLLENYVLPKLNNLPKIHYEVKSLIHNLGLGYESIHACENECVSYHNQHSHVEQCLVYG